MKNLSYIILALCLVSCQNKATKLEGQYHSLEQDGINIFLPVGFKYKTLEQIKASHRQVQNEKERFYYEKTLEEYESGDGNFYTYFNAEALSEIFIKTIPYFTFSEVNAKQLMYILRKDQEAYREVSGIQHDRIGATYFGDKTFQVFKGKYILSRYNSYDDKDEDFQMFKTIYLITSNKKTFMLHIVTPFETDYDPFIRKFKL